METSEVLLLYSTEWLYKTLPMFGISHDILTCSDFINVKLLSGLGDVSDDILRETPDFVYEKLLSGLGDVSDNILSDLVPGILTFGLCNSV